MRYYYFKLQNLDIWNSHICPAHYISGTMSAHYINHAPICNLKYWGVTTEMILGRGNNHNPSNGSGISNPHIVRVERGAVKSTCSCLTNNNRNGSRGELPFFVIPMMSSSVRERAFCCRTKRNLHDSGGCYKSV